MIFLANENFPFPSIQILRDTGFNVESIGEKYSGISDERIIRIAQQNNSIILTFDRDYGELIFRHAIDLPPAVVYFRLKGNSPEFAANLLLEILEKNIVLENHFTVVEYSNIIQRRY